MFECVTKHFFEIYLVLRIASQIFSQLGWHYLIQDKYCINIHNQSDYFCQQIHVLKNNESYEQIANEVFADSTKFYQF